MSRYKVLVGTIGTITADGKAAYHKAGELVDLAEAEAERLLHLGAVEDTTVPKPAAESKGHKG